MFTNSLFSSMNLILITFITYTNVIGVDTIYNSSFRERSENEEDRLNFGADSRLNMNNELKFYKYNDEMQRTHHNRITHHLTHA